MPSPSPAPVPQNQVPIVKELCEKLGFESRSDRQALLDSTHQWRRTYKCDDGTPGKDLVDWKSATTRTKLMIMTRDYLDRAGNGTKFWPMRGLPGPRTIPEYPEDKLSIRTSMHQLFWRQNLHENRNAKNPARHHSLSDKSVSSHEEGALFFTAPLTSKFTPLRKARENLPQRDRNLYSPESFSAAPYFTSKPVSRQASPVDQAHQDGEPQLRTINDLMTNTTGPESATREEDHGDVGNDKLSDLFEFHGSDDDIIFMGPMRKRSKKATRQAPTAKMVPDTNTVPDPNYNFDKQPSAEPTTLEKPKKLTKVPKKRRRIGSRVGSEEDDENYTPRKLKRKHTTSPKSVTSTRKSDASKTQEKNEVRHQSDPPSPSKERLQRNGNHDHAGQPPYTSAALMDRFNEARRALGPASIADSTQDSLVSDLQSQRTVDIVQQYPAMSEHMHIFSAEPQIARMTSSTDPNANTDAGVARQSESLQQTMEAHQMHHTISDAFDKRRVAARKARAQSAQAAHERLLGSTSIPKSPLSAEIFQSHDAKSDHDMIAQDPHLIRFLDLLESSRGRYAGTKSPSLRTEDAVRASQSQTLNVNEAQNEQASSGVKPDPATILPWPSIEETLPNKTPNQNEATQPPMVQHHPNNSPNSPQAPIAAAAASNAPSRITQGVPVAEAGLYIRYTIIKSRIPRFSRHIWSTGSLTGKTMDSLCDEVATLIGRPVLRCIAFKLKLSEGNDVEYMVQRRESAAFEDMRNVFTEEIEMDMESTGNKRFEILLEPDPILQAVAAEEQAQSGRGKIKFSI